jgi:hypothetical protein
MEYFQPLVLPPGKSEYNLDGAIGNFSDVFKRSDYKFRKGTEMANEVMKWIDEMMELQAEDLAGYYKEKPWQKRLEELWIKFGPAVVEPERVLETAVEEQEQRDQSPQLSEEEEARNFTVFTTPPVLGMSVERC